MDRRAVGGHGDPEVLLGTLYFFANYELEMDDSTNQQTQVLYYFVNGQHAQKNNQSDIIQEVGSIGCYVRVMFLRARKNIISHRRHKVTISRSKSYCNFAPIAQRKIAGAADTLLYIHKDHLGSAVRLTNANGNVLQI